MRLPPSAKGITRDGGEWKCNAGGEEGEHMCVCMNSSAYTDAYLC